MVKPIFDRTGARVYSYKRTTAPKAPRDDPEHRLQRQTYDYMNIALPPQFKIFSTLNGVYLGPQTRQKAAETGFRAGPLDLFIVGERRTRWLEAKVHPRKMSTEQLDFVSHLHPSAWGLFYTLEEAIDIVSVKFGIPLRPVVLWSKLLDATKW